MSLDPRDHTDSSHRRLDDHVTKINEHGTRITVLEVRYDDLRGALKDITLSQERTNTKVDALALKVASASAIAAAIVNFLLNYLLA